MYAPNHSPRPKPARGRRGFSLVELLAVVVIILILLSILMPLANQMQERGRSVNCLAKLRQIGGAIQVYMVDYNGVFPGSGGQGGMINTGPEPWQKEYMGKEVLDPGETGYNFGATEGTLVPYLGVAKTRLRTFYMCPSMPVGVRNAPWTGNNGRFDYTYFKVFAGAKRSSVPQKAQLYVDKYSYPTPLLTEEDPYAYVNNRYMDPGHSGPDRMGAWHLPGNRTFAFEGGSGNYAAVDGSASSVRAKDLADRSGSLYADRLLLKGPHANDWSAITPAGNRQIMGDQAVSYGQWNSL